MARKPLSSEKAAAVKAVSLAFSEEQQIEREARAEFETLLARRVEAARMRTNAAVFRARHTHGVTVAVLTDTGFGNTNRKNVTQRIEEYAEAHPEFVPATGTDATPVLKVAGLEVHQHDDSVNVVLDHFDHLDLGNDLTGSILFDLDGNELSHEPTLNTAYESNPLLGVTVWSLPETQAGIE